MCCIWVNASKSLVVSFICSREVHLKPILSRPSTIVHSFRVGLPCVQSNLKNTMFHSQNMLLISCHWWGIHQGPPVMSFVPSISTHYPESRLRNYLVPWSLHASMAGFLAFDSGFTSLTPDRKIPLDVRLQLIYSHSLECTMVPWESLLSLVIYLEVFNDINEWLVIKWFLPCLTSSHLFTWLDSYCIGIEMKILGWVFTLLCALPRLRWRSFDHVKYFSTITMLEILLIYMLT